MGGNLWPLARFPLSSRMLSLQSITKKFGALTALNRVSLEVAQGEFFGLLGPNGAGKSTLMSLVSGLKAPDAGSITLDGKPLVAADANARRALGLVPQGLALYPKLSAEANLEIFGGLYGLSGAELRKRIDAALEAVRLSDRRDEPIKVFSGGMQRRLNLAAALLHKPKLLLCDEPTVGVDPQSRNAIFDYLQDLNREGLTVIYSTHYMEEATRLCTRIGIIDHGEILALGSLDELLEKLPFEDEIRFAASEKTAGFAESLAASGSINSLDGVYRFRPKPEMRMSSFYAQAEAQGLPAKLFTSQRPTLEALFLHLTGRTLRE